MTEIMGSQSEQVEEIVKPETKAGIKEEFFKLSNGYLKMEQLKKVYTPKTFLQRVMGNRHELAISPGVIGQNFNFKSPFPYRPKVSETRTKIINDSRIKDDDPGDYKPQDKSVLDLAFLLKPDSVDLENKDGEVLGDDERTIIPRSKAKFRYIGNVATLQDNLVASSFKESTQQKTSFSNRSDGYQQLYFSSELRSLRGKVQRLKTRLKKKKKEIRQLRHQSNLLSFGFSITKEGEVKTMSDLIIKSVGAPVFIAETACDKKSLETLAQSTSPGSIGLPTQRNRFKGQGPTLNCGCLCFCSEREKLSGQEKDGDVPIFPPLEDHRWTNLCQKYKTQLTGIFLTKSSENGQTILN